MTPLRILQGKKDKEQYSPYVGVEPPTHLHCSFFPSHSLLSDVD